MDPLQTDADAAASVTGDADSRDPPRCPSCNYLLTGLTSRICPECGRTLADDFDLYRNSRMPTIWSTGEQFRVVRGVAAVLAHPIKTLEACGWPRRVNVIRAAVFALLCSIVLVLSWPVIREVGLCVVLLTRDGPAIDVWSRLPRQLAKLDLWQRLWHWEAWSMARWWILLGALTLPFAVTGGGTPSERSRPATLAVRLALFAPWIMVLELAYLVGVWAWERDVVPEPSTLFATSLTRWPVEVWMVRGVLPALAVGYLFFRAVIGLRRRAAVIGAAVLTPVAIYTSVAWSVLYMELFLR